MKRKFALFAVTAALPLFFFSSPGRAGAGEVSFVKTGPKSWYGILQTEEGRSFSQKIDISTDPQCRFRACSCSDLFILGFDPHTPVDWELRPETEWKDAIDLRVCYVTFFNQGEKLDAEYVDFEKPSYTRVEVKTLDCTFDANEDVSKDLQDRHALFTAIKDSGIREGRNTTGLLDLKAILAENRCEWPIYEEIPGL